MVGAEAHMSSRTHRRFTGSAVWLLLISLALCSLCSNASGQGAKPITVVFRYDDYSDVSPTQIERQMFQAFQSHGLRCTVAVIPFTYSSAKGQQHLIPLSEVKSALLRDAIREGAGEVAQHGYAHRALRRWRGVTEFAGVDYHTKEAEIDEGKGLLERSIGRPVRIFVPPWDSYDSTTLKVLEKLGFSVLSASQASVSGEYDRLWFLPHTTRLEQLESAVEAARRSSDPAPVVVVIFHPSDFIEVNPAYGQIRFSGLITILDWLRAQPDVRERSIGEVAGPSFDASRLRANGRLFYLNSELAPPFLSRLDLTGAGRIYVSASSADALLYKAIWPVAVFYFLVFLISIGASAGATGVVLRSAKVLRLARSTLTALLLVLAAYTFRNGHPQFLGACVFTCVAGAALGMYLDTKRRPVRINSYSHEK